MFRYPFEQGKISMDASGRGRYWKEPELSALQDFLIYVLAGLSQVVLQGKKVSLANKEIDRFTVTAVFATSNHVNFDPDRFYQLIKEALLLRDTMKGVIRTKCGREASPFGPVDIMATLGQDEMIKQWGIVGMQSYPADNPDILLLKQTLLYGIKGVCASADHALVLGQEDEGVYAFVHEGLAALQDKDMDIEDLLGLVIRCGEMTHTASELVNSGSRETFGHPVPTTVRFGFKKGKAILVSGRDFKRFQLLLEQTQDKQIVVYTHGDMIAANAYPRLKRFSHFFGHFGADRKEGIQDFSDFPGAVLMTTDCVQVPDRIRSKNMFTCGAAGCPGARHIRNSDFMPVIENARWCISLRQEGKELKTFLEPGDAELCMDGTQCLSLGLEITQLKDNMDQMQPC